MKRQHPTDPNLFWCSKCEGYLNRNRFGLKKSNKYGIYCYCRNCEREYSKRYSETHRDNRREYRKRWSDAHPGKLRECQNKYSTANNTKCAERGRQYRSRLPDLYVKYLLSATGIKNAAPETIELKREQIMLHRELKQLKGELQNGIA